MEVGPKELSLNVAPGYVRCAFAIGGWCGSDDLTLESGGVYTKYKGATKPIVVGHELVLRVMAIGDDVNPTHNLREGQYIVVEPYLPCRSLDCQECSEGRPNCCRRALCLGFQPHDGGFQKVVDVPDFCCHPIPSNRPEYVLTEPLAICGHATRWALGAMKFAKDDWQWIFANDPRELISTLAPLTSRRGTRTIVIALNSEVAARAHQIGAYAVVDFQPDVPLAKQAERIRNEFAGGSYPSVIYEMTGRSDILQESLCLARGEGRVVAMGQHYAINFELGPVRRSGTTLTWMPYDPRQRPNVAFEGLQMKAHEWVAIIGAGTIGLGLLQVLKFYQKRRHHPACKVMVMARNQAVLEFARRLGADAVHQIRTNESLEECMERARLEVTNGSYPVAVYETTGNVDVLRHAIHLTRWGGRTIALGCYNERITLEVNSSQISSLVFVRRENNRFPAAVEMLTEAPNMFLPLIGRQLSFEQLFPGVTDRTMGERFGDGFGPKTVIVP
jgi:threonine dehydrogenase-like Zn-dependent dehydrogenase